MPLTRPIHVPAGTVGQATAALGRQGQLNIAVPDRSLLSRPSAPDPGRMDAADALARVAKASGLKLKKVGANSYLLLAGNPSPRQTGRTIETHREGVESRACACDERSRRKSSSSPASATLRRCASQGSGRGSTATFCAARRAWRRGDRSAIGRLLVDPPRRGSQQAIHPRHRRFQLQRADAVAGRAVFRRHADDYSGPDPDLKLVDMQSVEILEGPQGTLYGSGALGGIVLLKPNMPSFDRMSGLRRRRHDGNLAWRCRLRFVGSAQCSTGENAALAAGRLSKPRGRLRRQSARPARRTSTMSTSRAAARPSPRSWRRAGSSTFPASASGSTATTANMPTKTGPGLSRSSLVDQPFSSDFTLASLVVRKDGGPIRFRSTTGASWQDVDENFDASTDGQIRQLRQRSKARALSNETRLWRPMADGYSWLVGFSSIVHRYGVDREIEPGTVAFDLAGVENRGARNDLLWRSRLRLLPEDRGEPRRALHPIRPVRLRRTSQPLVARQLADARRCRAERSIACSPPRRCSRGRSKD